MGLRQFVKAFWKTTSNIVRGHPILYYDKNLNRSIFPARPFRTLENFRRDSVKELIIKMSNCPVPESATQLLSDYVAECNKKLSEADNTVTELNRIFRFVWKEHSGKEELESSWTHHFMHFDSSWVNSELKRLKGLQKLSDIKRKKLLDEVKQNGQPLEFNELNEAIEKVVWAFKLNIGCFVKDVEYLTKSLNYQSAKRYNKTYNADWQGFSCGLIFFILSILLGTVSNIFQKQLKLAGILYTVFPSLSAIIMMFMILFPFHHYANPKTWINLLRRAHLAHYRSYDEFKDNESFFRTTPRSYILPLKKQAVDNINKASTQWEAAVSSLKKSRVCAGDPSMKELLDKAQRVAQNAFKTSRIQTRVLSQRTESFKIGLERKSINILSDVKYPSLECEVLHNCESFAEEIDTRINSEADGYKISFLQDLRTNFNKVTVHAEEHREDAMLYLNDLLSVSNYYIKKRLAFRAVTGFLGLGLAFVFGAGIELMTQEFMEDPWKHVPYKALMGTSLSFYVLAFITAVSIWGYKLWVSKSKLRIILGFFYS